MLLGPFFLCWSALTASLFVAALVSWRIFTGLSLVAFVCLGTFVAVDLHHHSQSHGTPGDFMIPVVVAMLFAAFLLSVSVAGLSAKAMLKSAGQKDRKSTRLNSSNKCAYRMQDFTE